MFWTWAEARDSWVRACQVIIPLLGSDPAGARVPGGPRGPCVVGEVGVASLYFITVLVQIFIARAEAAMPETRAFEYGSKVVGPVATLSVGLAGDLGDGVKVRLSVRVVMVAVPHDVVCVCTFSLARRVIAQVGSVNPRRLKSIGSTDAASNNCIENAPVLRVATVVERSAF